MLLDSADGRSAHLKHYYGAYLSHRAAAWARLRARQPDLARQSDWAAKLGYDAAGLKAINMRAIRFLEELRGDWRGSPLRPA